MTAKQAINDKLLGSLATYLRRGVVVNKLIKKGLLLSLRVKLYFLIGEYLAKLQARAWLSHRPTLCAPGQHTAKRRRNCTRQSRSCLQLCRIFTDLKNSTYTLSNKPFITWLLTTPPHLKYVVTLPCNMSLMACFADIHVSQGSVATYARCGGIFNIHLTTNLPRNLPVEKFGSDLIELWS